MFLLKIYFAGLIAFASGPDGQLHVLLVDARTEHTLSDGTKMAPHVPVLLARGVCSGDCGCGNQFVADYLFGGRARKPTPGANLENLGELIGSGAVWRLHDSILSLQGFEASPRGRDAAGIKLFASVGSIEDERIPGSSLVAQNFGWVADIGKIFAGSEFVHPDVLLEAPPSGLITARLTLDSGTLKTYSLVSLKEWIPGLTFRPLSSGPPDEAEAASAQVSASWVVAEIMVSGESVTLAERNFRSGSSRSVQIRPRQNEDTVEMAILNLPEDSFLPIDPALKVEKVGKHFELFYRLSKNRPPKSQFPVPFAVEEIGRNRSDIANTNMESGFVTTLSGRDTDTRGHVGRPICPVVYFSNGEGL